MTDESPQPPPLPMKLQLAQPVAVAPTVDAPRCSGHPAVAAMASCDRCGRLLCSVCMFEVTPTKHLCPNCAISASTTFSPKRRTAMIAGYIFAAIAMVTFTLMMMGVLQSAIVQTMNEQLLGIVITVTVFLPATVGLAWSWGAIEKRFHNPAPLWAAVVLNAIVVAAFILLTIIGLFGI